MWLTASEALGRLGTKPQTLYANVSRGRIRAKPDPADSRRSLYSAEDVERLATRRAGRRSTAAVAAEAISWGDPVLVSALTTFSGGRLYYRGIDAVELSQGATLEEVATLLWDGPWALTSPSPAIAGPHAGTVFSLLAEQAARAVPSYGRGPLALRTDAGAVLASLADALLGSGEGLLHLRLAARLGRPQAADDLRRALVLLADHELNSSTFAARVTVSTGASLAAGALSGFAALSGPLHGEASAAVMALVADIGTDASGADQALREWLGEGRIVPGFGHRLYPLGDVRCAALLSHIAVPPAYEAVRRAAERLADEKPNVDFALAALTDRWDLPSKAPLTIFALARCVGWLAHMLEQAATGTLIRPRARYIGPQVGRPEPGIASC